MICDDAMCARLEELYGERTHLTIREATPAEREPGGVGEFWATGKPMQAQRYLVVDAEEPTRLLGAFGLVDGAETKEEAVFWAERWASKNGGHFLRPDGFEGVVGALPDETERVQEA